ncbi:hypothetical protein [Nocardia pseudobrasiliensis]|uniref:Ig-like domain-containing protein n=1 Tax=Nocardia pseudobrasiliensis TaxID=45979 RepID=A0A370HZN7_9NOCA|nr:hypothetical protein [Nocardia pseudobrasiliensis]RDI63973.1 hypothetical protein DFR76_109313 [Nocardia pseudobrasiliensis]
MKLLAGLPIGLMLAALAAPAAEAVPIIPNTDSDAGPHWICTAKSIDGQDLPQVEVPARLGANQARMRARPEWYGQADFDTIACVPKGR